MAQLTKDDVRKLADLSALKLSDDEVTALLSDLQNLISYVDELNAVPATVQHATPGNKNVFREDKAIASDSAPLLAQAPEHYETYFVVPKVVDSSKDAS